MHQLFKLKAGDHINFDNTQWLISAVTFYKWGEADVELSLSYTINYEEEEYYLDLENPDQPEIFLYTKIDELALEAMILEVFNGGQKAPKAFSYDAINFTFEGQCDGTFLENNHQENGWMSITALDYANEEGEEDLAFAFEYTNNKINMFLGHEVDASEITIQ